MKSFFLILLLHVNDQKDIYTILSKIKPIGRIIAWCLRITLLMAICSDTIWFTDVLKYLLNKIFFLKAKIYQT